MPWKLILSLILMTLLIVFAGFNLDNKSSISFGFAEISDVPIFISLFFAFLAGIIVTSPFIFMQKRKVRKKLKENQPDYSPDYNETGISDKNVKK
jgi:uncharacterized integral membrane protein